MEVTGTGQSLIWCGYFVVSAIVALKPRDFCIWYSQYHDEQNLNNATSGLKIARGINSLNTQLHVRDRDQLFMGFITIEADEKIATNDEQTDGDTPRHKFCFGTLVEMREYTRITQRWTVVANLDCFRGLMKTCYPPPNERRPFKCRVYYRLDLNPFVSWLELEIFPHMHSPMGKAVLLFLANPHMMTPVVEKKYFLKPPNMNIHAWSTFKKFGMALLEKMLTTKFVSNVLRLGRKKMKRAQGKQHVSHNEYNMATFVFPKEQLKGDPFRARLVHIQKFKSNTWFMKVGPRNITNDEKITSEQFCFVKKKTLIVRAIGKASKLFTKAKTRKSGADESDSNTKSRFASKQWKSNSIDPIEYGYPLINKKRNILGILIAYYYIKQEPWFCFQQLNLRNSYDNHILFELPDKNQWNQYYADAELFVNLR